jgi:hypothetical protein
MNKTNLKVGATMLAVASLLVAPASAQRRTNVQPTAPTDGPTALYVRICLWSAKKLRSPNRQTVIVCNEVPLTPGAAGPVFDNMKACLDGQTVAMEKWRTQAGPVFGYTSNAGDGYRITGQHCGPVRPPRRGFDPDDVGRS